MVISIVAGFGLFGGILIVGMFLATPILNYFYPTPVICSSLSESQPENCVSKSVATEMMDNQFLIGLLMILMIFGISLFVSSFVAGFLAKAGTVELWQSLVSGFIVSTICPAMSIVFVLAELVREREGIFSLAQPVDLTICFLLWGVPSAIVGLVAGYSGGICHSLKASHKLNEAPQTL